MLSSQLRRGNQLRKVLEANKAKTQESDFGYEQKNLMANAAVSDFFYSAANVYIDDAMVYVTMPVQKKGWLWDSWEEENKSYPNTTEGRAQFIDDIAKASVAIKNRIDNYDNGTATMQTLTSAGAAIIQILQVTMAANQLNAEALSSQSYTNYQISLSAIMTGLSYIANMISTGITNEKNSAINFQTAILDLETSQEVNVPQPVQSAMLHLENSQSDNGQPLTHSTVLNLENSQDEKMQPLAQSKVPAGANTLIGIRPSITTALLPSSAPTTFMPVGNRLMFKGSTVDVMMPAKNSGCTLRPWSEVYKEYDLNAKGFSEFKGTLFALKTQLDAQTTSYDTMIARIQTYTSLGTTLTGIVQTAVVAAQNGSINLEVFQLVISSVNSLLAVAAKAASSGVTTLRNSAATYSGDVAEILAAQISPAPRP